jgi:hypothetical protein
MPSAVIVSEKLVRDIENNQSVINNFMVVLQHHFKNDMKYKRPLIPPQINIVYAIDGEDVINMINYMSKKLTDIGIFLENEFRFIRRSGEENNGVHRFRLEFTEGVTCELIRKISYATEQLEKTLPES